MFQEFLCFTTKFSCAQTLVSGTIFAENTLRILLSIRIMLKCVNL